MQFSVRLVIGLGTFLVIGTYLGFFAYLLRYLRRHYTMFWVDLGEPSFSLSRAQNNSFEFASSSLSALQFVFSKQYRAVEDRRLCGLVWLVRGFFAASIVLIIIEIVAF